MCLCECVCVSVCLSVCLLCMCPIVEENAIVMSYYVLLTSILKFDDMATFAKDGMTNNSTQARHFLIKTVIQRLRLQFHNV